MSSRLRRIVARVDETGRSEDTQEGERPWRLKPPKGQLHAISGRGIGNNSSLFRIYALLKNGKGTGEKENKVELNFVKYFPEIGVEKQSLDNFNDGGTGAGCAEQIDEVYYLTIVSSCQHRREPMKVKFLGPFDTAKQPKSSEEVDTPDVSQIEHRRHALAINEKREHFPALLLEPVDNAGQRGQEVCHQQADFSSSPLVTQWQKIPQC
ncbi:hypothetical protein CMEL01_16381 [Colletotrichum melonis]|uniref:Uncharacterized protein n=1 Tax=Colletotrichum melonis TaxID=1209925 RepID=A0AAI9XNF1_9PEZI|nr:hypothetical protein CMEL01_16381 [Colletotrichum melonis]